MIVKVSLLSLLVTITFAGFIDRPKQGCPEPIDVKPCVCTNSPLTFLECENINDPYVLRDVFKNSSRYSFKEVHIKYSVMQFLPNEIFEKVRVSKLYLKNVTLVQLFDRPPQNLHQLDTLHIENTRILRGTITSLLESLSHLRIFNVYFNNVKTVGPDFSQYVTKELKQISFYGTGTKLIKPGTFKDFVNLEKVAFEDCKLTTLTRDIFPKPFNVRYLLFNQNKISVIPDDMFSEMPNLQTIGLKHNEIAIVPEPAFHGSLSNIEYFQLDGNPLICDCRLAWLIQNKPPALSGRCDLPTTLQGTGLRDLKPDFFIC